jgi:co-chaperonin GroES (HSP10)
MAEDHSNTLDQVLAMASEFQEPKNEPTPRRVRPIRDQVLVRQDPKENKVAGGLLYTPEGSEHWPSTGTVEAVGPGLPNAPMDEGLMPGARVLFQRRPASALHRDLGVGEPEEWKGLIMLRESDILGIIEEE